MESCHGASPAISDLARLRGNVVSQEFRGRRKKPLYADVCVSSRLVLIGVPPERIWTAIAWLIGRATAFRSETKVADKAKESC
jgi:hypothetical protein